jgi:hypothetical protein
MVLMDEWVKSLVKSLVWGSIGGWKSMHEWLDGWSPLWIPLFGVPLMSMHGWLDGWSPWVCPCFLEVETLCKIGLLLEARWQMLATFFHLVGGNNGELGHPPPETTLKSFHPNSTIHWRNFGSLIIVDMTVRMISM